MDIAILSHTAKWAIPPRDRPFSLFIQRPHGGDERRWILTLPVRLRHTPKLLAILDSFFYHVSSRSVLSRSNVVKFVVLTSHIKSEYPCNAIWRSAFIILFFHESVRSTFIHTYQMTIRLYPNNHSIYQELQLPNYRPCRRCLFL